jgi:hypothetical protein
MVEMELKVSCWVAERGPGAPFGDRGFPVAIPHPFV